MPLSQSGENCSHLKLTGLLNKEGNEKTWKDPSSHIRGMHLHTAQHGFPNRALSRPRSAGSPSKGLAEGRGRGTPSVGTGGRESPEPHQQTALVSPDGRRPHRTHESSA